MITVYRVSSPDLQPTRLFLPATSWGNLVQERLRDHGYTVQATAEADWPDTRSEAEHARKDDLLGWAAPI